MTFSTKQIHILVTGVNVNKWLPSCVYTGAAPKRKPGYPLRIFFIS